MSGSEVNIIPLSMTAVQDSGSELDRGVICRGWMARGASQTNKARVCHLEGHGLTPLLLNDRLVIVRQR